ncbi:Serpin domain containing protein, partial [Asbolus verrucosus]
TSNKIKNLISPDILDNNTRTVLINALYFKGNWTNRFANYTTKQEDFYKTSKDVVKVDTMHHYREWFNYCENSVLKAKFLELPFEGEDISMIIALPNEKEGLASLEEQIEKVFAPQNFTSEFLNVALPKFKVESTLELKNALKNLGVEKAFNDTEADLSGIAGDKGDLIISDALQKTYIDVEEGGVEAA